jgi:hypothetical protein
MTCPWYSRRERLASYVNNSRTRRKMAEETWIRFWRMFGKRLWFSGGGIREIAERRRRDLTTNSCAS